MGNRLFLSLIALLLSLQTPLLWGASAAPSVGCLAPVLNHERARPWTPEAAILEAWLDSGDHALLGAHEKEPRFPPSIRKVATTERIKNEVVFKIFRWMSSRLSSSATGDKVLQKIAQVIERVRGSPFRFLVEGSIFRRLDGLLNHPSIKQTDGTVTLKRYAAFHETFLRDIDQDRANYGSDFFDEEAVAQGAINTFAIKLFATLENSQDAYSREAANAISLLHPIVDKAMDQGFMTKSTFGKLEKYLNQAENPLIESPYEKVLFEYLGRFETAFPRKQVPGFWFSLSRLFQSQVRSLKQKSAGLSHQDYYRIAQDKGGLSTVLAAYTALGPLTKNQYEFFYRSGGIFQVIDDLLDIKKDTNEGVKTVWTETIKNKKSFAGPIRELLAMESKIETDLDAMASDFADPEAFKKVYQFSFKLSLMRGLARQSQYLDAEAQALLKNRMSLSMSSLKQMLQPTPQKESNAPPGSDLWFMNQLMQMTETY